MKKGKKHIFFPFLFSQLILTSQGLIAQNLDHIISSLMNFPEFSVISLEDIKNRSLEVRSQLVYNDVLRKQVNGIAALTYNGLDWEIDTFIPWSRAPTSYAMHLSCRGHGRWFQNKQDRTALYAKNHSAGARGTFQLAMTKDRKLLGGGLALYSKSFDTPIWIKGFPESNNNAMRKFFLDWLEPTFGRQLDIDGHAKLYKPTLFASFPIFQKKHLTLSVSRLSLSADPEMLYVNTSNKPELAGNRKISVAFKSREDLIDIGVENELAGTRISITLFDSRFGLNIDNNPPQTRPILLDYEELGNAKGNRSGFSLKYGVELKHYLFRFGLGKSYYGVDFNINTPVLGYYENFFPIAHSAEGKVTGNSFTQAIEAGATKTIISTKSSFKVGYTHGFFDLRLEGDALLGFNLFSTPIDHPLQYHVHLLSIEGKLARRFGPVTSSYSFSQLIPFVVRSDTSPIHFSEEVAGVSTRSRGGGFHQFALSYQW